VNVCQDLYDNFWMDLWLLYKVIAGVKMGVYSVALKQSDNYNCVLGTR
jgi:hypothetical protein